MAMAMASSSSSSSIINTCALYSHNTQPFSSIFIIKHHGVFYNIHKPQLSIHPPPTPRRRHKPDFTTFHAIPTFFTNISHSPPTSYLPRMTLIAPSLPPQTKSHHLFSKKMAVLLVGSFLLMECLCRRTPVVLALPAQKISVCHNLEDNKEDTTTQYENSEEAEMYVKILEKNPRDVNALKVLVYGFMRKGNTKEAVVYVERLIDVQPNELEWRLLQAICYEMMGHLSRAKRLFKDILQERPLLLRALHGLAMVMHKNHEGPSVFEMLNKALEVACREKRVTEERNIKILIAQMHVIKGELEDGLKKFQNLVEENPRDFRPYLCQGIVYSLLDKTKEAEEQFEAYKSLVSEEFPQRGFLDDVVLTAKTKSQEGLKKDFEAEFSFRK